jgi:hypothetical protein
MGGASMSLMKADSSNAIIRSRSKVGSKRINSRG